MMRASGLGAGRIVVAGWLAIAAVLAIMVGAAWWRSRQRRARFISVPEKPAQCTAGPLQVLPVESGDADGFDAAVESRLCALAFEGVARWIADPEDPRHAEVAHAAAGLLSQLEAGSRYSPRRPRLLPMLLQAVNDEDASGRDIANIIAQDPALAGNLLRVANSAFYRVREQPIDSIERAVAMIGTDGVRRLIAVALVQPVLGGGNDGWGRLVELVWEHSLLSAEAAVLHARQVEQAAAFAAQMAALVHGLGAITVVRVARDAYAQRPVLVPAASAIADLLEQWTAPTAQRVAADWQLSSGMAVALADQRRDLAPDQLTPLGRSLQIGRLAGALALAFRRGDLKADAALAQLQRAGLRESAAARIWQRIAGDNVQASVR